MYELNVKICQGF